MNLSQSAEQAYAAGRWQDAARYYDELLSLNPANSLGWFRLGNIALREKRTQDAISHYEAAIEVYGTDPRYWHNLAIARIRQAQDVLQQGQRVFIADRSKQASLKALDTRIDAIWQAPEAEDADVAGNFDSSQTLP